jgi:hypothetical protein
VKQLTHQKMLWGTPYAFFTLHFLTLFVETPPVIFFNHKPHPPILFFKKRVHSGTKRMRHDALRIKLELQTAP